MQPLVALFLAISLSQVAPVAPTGRIEGRVTIEGANAPIAGARIILIPAGRRTGPIVMPPQAATDQDGRFVFDNVAPGEYRLDAQKTGFAPLSGPGIPPTTIQVAAGQSVDVSVQLEKGGVIAGKLLAPSGEPFPDARIVAARIINGPAGAAPPRFVPAPMQGPQQTNDLGEFRVSGLAPGEYYLAAMPPGVLAMGRAAAPLGSPGKARTAIATTFYPGTTDQAAAQPVAVTAGAEVDNIVFTMQSAPAFRVSGFVVDEDGKPVARAMVMLMGDPRSGIFGPVGSAQTQDDGRFVIGDVPSGTYRLSATGALTVNNVRVSGGVERPAEIVVGDADVEGARVVIRRPPQ